ncbi:uncharacterized protein LOC112601013 [Melanaphis sacchari]|uniref:uncharacterized protein LOC112601013 n=1 Tax=Melanaphis sacchari TaxID=742174 RepID=UPI000DC13A69|nr:uncharacterized protein LOC112601013 [Melanaphis sacchari]
MDILYPCSQCSQTFTLRKDILKHMETVHKSSVSIICDDDSKSLLNCSQCHKKFNNNSLLDKHLHLEHSNSKLNLSKYNSRPSKKRVIQKLNAYLSLKDCLPDNYSYKILAFKDILYGQFKAKFLINNIDKESFLDWLDNLCNKTKVNYITDNVPSISLKNIYRKVYKCKNTDYWNIKSNSILQNPTNCNASLTVMIKPLNRELAHQSKAVILMKHCHCHPKNYLTPMKSLDIFHVYDQFVRLLKNGLSAAGALHIYSIKIIQNEGKNHYLELMDSGIKPDVEFVYELYYRHIRKSSFSSPFSKRVDSLMKSLNYYNVRVGRNSAAIELIKNNIVVAIRTPLMGTINTDTVIVCSTSSDICKTWFMFSETSKKIMIPVGVIISTDDKKCLLKAGLCLWEKLGGRIKTVIVDLVYTHIFKTVFPKATVCISKFHFLVSVWKWFINVTNKNNLIEELNCFIELKKIVCSESFIVDHFIDTNFANVLIEKYPNFNQFIQSIDKNNFLYCSTMSTHPCSTISERKFIYYHTKSLSILQTFHFVIDEINFFYKNLVTEIPNHNQQLILNNFKEINRDDNCFTYCCVNENHSMYLVENNDGGKFFVDMGIGLCSCTLNNICSPCIHQVFLSEHLNKKTMHCSVDNDTYVLNTTNYDEQKQNAEKKEFENILSEFQFVHNKIKEQFMIDPEYFKVGIQRFVSTWKNNLTSDKSLLLACNSLSNIYQSNLDDS